MQRLTEKRLPYKVGGLSSPFVKEQSRRGSRPGQRARS